MAIDLDALRAKHEELSGNKPAGGNADFLSNFIQLQDGTNSVRILPGKDEGHYVLCRDQDSPST
jgi:hypothetical protein